MTADVHCRRAPRGSDGRPHRLVFLKIEKVESTYLMTTF